MPDRLSSRGSNQLDFMTPDPTTAKRDLLEFYVAAGVDAAVDEVAADRLSPAQRPAGEPAISSRPGPAHPFPGPEPPPQRAPDFVLAQAPASPGIAVMAARETARSAASLDELRELLT